MFEFKICINCTHCNTVQSREDDEDGFGTYDCTHPLDTHTCLVTGEVTYSSCGNARSEKCSPYYITCGEDGSNFEPKLTDQEREDINFAENGEA